MEGLPAGMKLPEGAGQQRGEDPAEQEAKRVQEAEQKRTMMAAVLDSGARERLSRIAMVSPQRSQQIEGILMRMAQQGQLKGRVTEAQLIELLEQMEEVQGKATGAGKKSNIIYQRRKSLSDDDW